MISEWLHLARQAHSAIEGAETFRVPYEDLAWPVREVPASETLSAHLWKHLEEWFTFLSHPEVEPTNYQGEQAIRPAVVNRKVWGGNRTWAGAHALGEC